MVTVFMIMLAGAGTCACVGLVAKYVRRLEEHRQYALFTEVDGAPNNDDVEMGEVPSTLDGTPKDVEQRQGLSGERAGSSSAASALESSSAGISLYHQPADDVRAEAPCQPEAPAAEGPWQEIDVEGTDEHVAEARATTETASIEVDGVQ